MPKRPYRLFMLEHVDHIFYCESKERAKEIFSAHNLLVAVNLLGIPAATVCTGLQDDRPYGVQLIGWKYNEHLCLDLAQMIEDHVGRVAPIDPKIF